LRIMDYREEVLSAKRRRLLSSIPTTDFLSACALVVGILTIGASIVGGTLSENTKPYLWVCEIVAIFFTPFLIWMIKSKTLLEFNRRTYDPSLVSNFQQQFDALDETCHRQEAATVCLAFLQSRVKLDEK